MAPIADNISNKAFSKVEILEPAMIRLLQLLSEYETILHEQRVALIQDEPWPFVNDMFQQGQVVFEALQNHKEKNPQLLDQLQPLKVPKRYADLYARIDKHFHSIQKWLEIRSQQAQKEYIEAQVKTQYHKLFKQQ